VPVVYQIPTFPIGVNVMQINGLRRIHIVSPADYVWTLCTAGAGNYVNQTARIILEQQFYVHKNRLAVMYSLAVHNVRTANCDILAHFAVRQGNEIVSPCQLASCDFFK
jgi:hypothetical protein